MSIPFTRVIANYDFRMLWFAQISSQLALNVLIFVLGIEIFRLTLSNTAVSLMMLTFGLPAVVFGVLFGGIVDDFDKRKILLLCNLSRAGFILLFFFFHGNIYFLYAFSILTGIITQLFIPAEVPSIPALVSKKDLMSANSLFTVTFYMSTISGSIAAGPLINYNGTSNIFFLISMLMLLASYFVYRMPAIPAIKKGKSKWELIALLSPIIEGLIFIKNHSRIRQCLFLLTFAQALVSTLVVLAPGFAHQVLRINLEDVSLVVMGPAAIGLVTGAFAVSFFSRRILRGTLILTGILLTGATLFILAVVGYLNLHGMILIDMMLLFLLGIANSMINVPSSTILQEETDRDMRGRIYGVLTSLIGAFTILPVLFSGILADTAGISLTLLVIGVAVISTGFIYTVKRKFLFIFQNKK